MSSPVEFACLGALVTSGFVSSGFDLVGDISSFSTIMNASTTMDYHLTGTFKGLDAISEYLSGFGSVVNPTGLISIGATGPVTDLSESTEEECVFLTIGAYRFEANVLFTPDGAPACADSMIGNSFRFVATGNASQPIHMKSWNVWTRDEWVKVNFGLFDSEATSRLVCDVIHEECAAVLQATSKCSSSSGRRVGMATKDACLESLGGLPALTNEFWADGNSRLCRALHGLYARTNPEHCPHVSLALEADVNGDFKCVESKGTTAEELFLPSQIEFFESHRLPYDNSSYVAAYTGRCPPIEELKSRNT